MRVRSGIIFLSALCLSAPAFAATITNKDEKEYKLTVAENGAKQELILKPGGVFENICLKGCVLRVGDSENDEYILEGPEVLSVEEGLVYDDSTDAKTEPAPGLTQPPPVNAQPPAQPSK